MKQRFDREIKLMWWDPGYEVDKLAKYFNTISGGDRSFRCIKPGGDSLETTDDLGAKSNQPRINTKQEIEFYERVKAGDLEARRDLIKSNLGYLFAALAKEVHNACKYKISLCDIADSVVEEIFTKRLEKYDPKVGRSLSSFLFYGDALKWVIRKQIEIASFNGMTWVSKRKPIPILPMPPEGNVSLVELSPDEIRVYDLLYEMQKELPTSADDTMHRVDYEKLQEVVATLSPNQKYAIEQHFFNNRDSKEIGFDLGLTRQAVDQNIFKALKKLRFKMRGDINLEKRLNGR